MFGTPEAAVVEDVPVEEREWGAITSHKFSKAKEKEGVLGEVLKDRKKGPETEMEFSMSGLTIRLHPKSDAPWSFVIAFNPKSCKGSKSGLMSETPDCGAEQSATATGGPAIDHFSLVQQHFTGTVSSGAEEKQPALLTSRLQP